MTGIEIVAIVLFATAMLGAFLSFWPQWAPESGPIRTVWDAITNMHLNVGMFITGMILLYLWG